jgi:hypothetical protein
VSVEGEYSWITNEMFDQKLREILGRMKPDELLAIPGVYEEISEHLNNQVLDELKEEREKER